MKKDSGIGMELIQKSFNNAIGNVMQYLDEAEVGFGTKRAVKAELWDLCDKYIKPAMAEVIGNEQEQEINGNV